MSLFLLRCMSNWNRSQCLGSWLHRFSIVAAFENAVKERCDICHQEQTFQVREGRIDNLNYLTYHMRQVLVPQHSLHKHEYPK